MAATLRKPHCWTCAKNCAGSHTTMNNDREQRGTGAGSTAFGHRAAYPRPLPAGLTTPVSPSAVGCQPVLLQHLSASSRPSGRSTENSQACILTSASPAPLSVVGPAGATPIANAAGHFCLRLTSDHGHLSVPLGHSRATPNRGHLLRLDGECYCRWCRDLPTERPN